MQEFTQQQFQQAAFDYHRLRDEFQERVLSEFRVRLVTPLVKQPGILAITEQGLYFQALHNVTGGPAVRFHPGQSITSLARRLSSMRPVALEVFMMPSTSDAMRFVRPDQVCRDACSAALRTWRRPRVPQAHLTTKGFVQKHAAVGA